MYSYTYVKNIVKMKIKMKYNLNTCTVMYLVEFTHVHKFKQGTNTGDNINEGKEKVLLDR